MDFQRGTQPQTAAPATHVATDVPQSSSRRGRRSDQGKLGRITTVAIAGVIVLLLLAVVAFMVFNNNSVPDENKYVDTSKLQAVFLNTGQVYFGDVKTLNDKYFVLTNIYYLQTSNSSSSSSSSNTSVSLVKLGCELHAPYDQMVVNAQQVTFWENLQADGQVAKAVAKFEQQNPNGQKCADQSTSSGSTSSSVQSAGSSTAPTTSTSTKP